MTSEEHGIGRYGYTTQEHGVFKIDTQTGKTWIFDDVDNLTTNKANPGYVGWRELKDTPTNRISN